MEIGETAADHHNSDIVHLQLYYNIQLKPLVKKCIPDRNTAYVTKILHLHMIIKSTASAGKSSHRANLQ